MTETYVNTDLQGFLEAGSEDCEERMFTLDGKEITDEFTE